MTLSKADNLSGDLNAFGRIVTNIGWFISNVRLRFVSIFISLLMGALLAAGVIGTVSTFRSVAEIETVWRTFDTKLARRLVLLSELRQYMGFGGLMQHFHDYILTGDPLLKQAITTDFVKLKEIGPAYVTAGASADEQEALRTVYGVVDAYERAMPQVIAAVERKESPAAAHLIGSEVEAPALKALDHLGRVLSSEHRDAADQAVMERAQRREELTNAFGVSATRLLTAVDQAVRHVGENAAAVQGVAEKTGEQAQSVTVSAGQASANVQEVATATAQLSASGRDISNSVSRSAEITRDAVIGIEGLSTTMSSLDAAAHKIGEIVTLIGEIAAQTNLLALNASIEAQRAGDSGKGFAVVANEVKALAGQTSRATDEIAEQVHSIQATTQDAVTALKDVGKTILNADEVVATIASAIEEQNAATDSIVHSVHEAARGDQEVSTAIAEVSSAAENTGDMASRMVSVTESLRAEADTMKTEVQNFLSAVRST